MTFKNQFFLIVMIGSLSGCQFGVPIGEGGAVKYSVAHPTKPGSQGNPSSYVVFGKRYYVLDKSKGFKQRGIASWYGTKFHGRKTSSGEVYNMYSMTAAHKTLPIPVFVHVKNLENGREAVVKVNDRGPFIDGRIIDLSYAAAKKLGVQGPGVAQVEISVLAVGQSKPVANLVRTMPLNDLGLQEKPLFVQMGSFSDEANASNLVQILRAASESKIQISQLQTDGGLFHRVRLGPFFDINHANEVVERLQQKGFQTARILVQDSPE